jgi:hypothetical protein
MVVRCHGIVINARGSISIPGGTGSQRLRLEGEGVHFLSGEPWTRPPAAAHGPDRLKPHPFKRRSRPGPKSDRLNQIRGPRS